MSFLGALIYGYRYIRYNAADLAQRSYLNFTGAGVAVADNPSTGATDVTIGAPTSPTTFGPSAAAEVTSYTAALATTGATPTIFTGAQFTCPDLTTIDVVVTVLGKKLASADTFCQDYRGRYYRNGGSLTLIGSVIAGPNPVGTGTLATAAATILLSGNVVAPQVTGVAATNIDWSVTMTVQQVQ